jgi:hypothetical protein
MGTERTRQLLLGALLVVLALIAYRAWPWTSTVAVPASNGTAAAPRAARARGAQPAAGKPAPEVHLNSLGEERPKPIDAERDLFRFKLKAPPPPPRVTERSGPVAPPVLTGPPAPPPLSPIALKFIGIVQQGDASPKIAVLTDGRHMPFYGREGDIIEGRYKILRIGVESIDLAYADGRGRQTIRLTGS